MYDMIIEFLFWDGVGCRYFLWQVVDEWDDSQY